MRRQGRAMKGELEHGVDIALAGGSIIALAGLAFVAVVREGLETVLFLFAIGSSSGPVVQTARRRVRRPRRSRSASAGRSSGGRPGRPAALLHRHRHRPDLRVGRAGRVRGRTSSARPGSSRTPARSSTSARSCPSRARSVACSPGCSATARRRPPLEVVAYLAYLIPVLILFLKPARRPSAAPAPAAS